jgi:hypothetical protein
VYVVSGHYDSRATDVMDFTSDAPGANDDASGVAVAMELARVMAGRRPAATLVFAALAAEEQGLYGAAYMAQRFRDAGVDVQGMFTTTSSAARPPTTASGIPAASGCSPRACRPTRPRRSRDPAVGRRRRTTPRRGSSRGS